MRRYSIVAFLAVLLSASLRDLPSRGIGRRRMVKFVKRFITILDSLPLRTILHTSVVA